MVLRPINTFCISLSCSRFSVVWANVSAYLAAFICWLWRRDERNGRCVRYTCSTEQGVMVYGATHWSVHFCASRIHLFDTIIVILSVQFGADARSKSINFNRRSLSPSRSSCISPHCAGSGNLSVRSRLWISLKLYFSIVRCDQFVCLMRSLSAFLWSFVPFSSHLNFLFDSMFLPFLMIMIMDNIYASIDRKM